MLLVNHGAAFGEEATAAAALFGATCRDIAASLQTMDGTSPMGKKAQGTAKKKKREIVEEQKTLARNLRIARQDAGLTQDQLAILSGVSQRIIWQIEDPEQTPNITIQTLAKLARALQKKPGDLLTPITWG